MDSHEVGYDKAIGQISRIVFVGGSTSDEPRDEIILIIRERKNEGRTGEGLTGRSPSGKASLSSIYGPTSFAAACALLSAGETSRPTILQEPVSLMCERSTINLSIRA